MILKLLFMSDLWLGTIDIKQRKAVKKRVKQRNMTS